MAALMDPVSHRKLTLAVGEAAASAIDASVAQSGGGGGGAGVGGEVNTAITTAGAGVLTAAAIAGGVITRTGPTVAYTDTTATAAAIWNAVPGAAAGQSFELEIRNMVAFTETLAAGVGITLSGITILPPLSVGRFLVTLTSSTAAVIFGLGTGIISELPLTLDNTVSTGTGTMVSGAMEGAEFVTLTASGQGAITLTTRTAAQIQANVPNWQVGQTYRLRIVNNNTGTLTTAGGANVTMTSTIPANSVADYTILFATATTITTTQINVAPVAVLPAAKFTSINVTTGTLAAGNASGAAFVQLTSTNATPGSQAMRTPAQVLADSQAAGLAIGGSYVLRIKNTGAGTFTLATDSGTGFTMTGTMTILQNMAREFVVTINTATTGTVQDIGSAVDSSPVNGVAAGYKIARGEHTQVAASDTIVSGLATVVAVVVSPRTITVKQMWFQGSPGDQAGTPAAGSFLLTSKKATNNTNDSTPTAATDFTDNVVVDWIAVGTAILFGFLSFASAAISSMPCAG